jgi:Asp-tRNA(Asn)/Glu-tRNA(Gln) amidotransferase A subunit family amidase
LPATWPAAASPQPADIGEKRRGDRLGPDSDLGTRSAASLCAGYDADGLPIGLQIVGHRFDDLGVLRMARAYEALRPPPQSWPAP